MTPVFGPLRRRGTSIRSSGSGTNGWHGSRGSIFGGNTVLDANSRKNNTWPQASAKRISISSAALLAAPSQKKNKAFVFLYFEGWQERVPSRTRSPTPFRLNSATVANFSRLQQTIYDTIRRRLCVSGVVRTPGSAEGQFIRGIHSGKVLNGSRISQIRTARLWGYYPGPKDPACLGTRTTWQRKHRGYRYPSSHGCARHSDHATIACTSSMSIRPAASSATRTVSAAGPDMQHAFKAPTQRGGSPITRAC